MMKHLLRYNIPGFGEYPSARSRGGHQQETASLVVYACVIDNSLSCLRQSILLLLCIIIAHTPYVRRFILRFPMLACATSTLVRFAKSGI